MVVKGASLAPLAREYRLYREVLPISSVERYGFLEVGDGFPYMGISPEFMRDERRRWRFQAVRELAQRLGVGP